MHNKLNWLFGKETTVIETTTSHATNLLRASKNRLQGLDRVQMY